mgnify:CR=1 FL=1
MTGLLISVRNRQEAETIITACPDLDILDIKEPNAGALGAAAPQVWQDIADINLNNTSLSIALGELSEVVVSALADLPPNTQYVKVGLAHQRGLNWIQAWRAMQILILDSAELVGVIYADYQAAAAPAPTDIIKLLSKEGCRTFLIDTYQKKQADLFDHLTRQEFDQLKMMAPEATFVIAGSLTESSISKAKQLNAEFVGVRGAICEDSRNGQVSAEKSKHMLKLVKTC